VAANPSVRRNRLCVLDHETFGLADLNPLPGGRFCRRLKGTLLPVRPGERGPAAPPLGDDSTCADSNRASDYDRADYVAGQYKFGEARDPRDPRNAAIARTISNVCARAGRAGKARKIRLGALLGPMHHDKLPIRLTPGEDRALS